MRGEQCVAHGDHQGGFRLRQEHPPPHREERGAGGEYLVNLVTKMIKVELRLIVRGKAKRKTILCQSLKGGTTQVLEETNKAGLNALLLAVHTGQPEVGNILTASEHTGHIIMTKVVCKLLECGANPDSRDNDGETAVHAAVREESSQMLQILLKVPTPASTSNPHSH